MANNKLMKAINTNSNQQPKDLIPESHKPKLKTFYVLIHVQYDIKENLAISDIKDELIKLANDQTLAKTLNESIDLSLKDIPHYYIEELTNKFSVLI